MFNRLTVIIIFICCILIFFSCGREDIDSEQFLDIQQTPALTSGSEILDQLFFVGKYERRIGVYKYDFSSKSYKIFWGTDQETVIKLSYSNDLENIFFLTAGRIGISRGVSSIYDIKLYRIDVNNSSTELISEIGNAVQLYTNWSGNNYKIQFTRFDLKYSSHINKFSQTYSRFGKLLKEEKESFNFITDRYPDFYIPHNPLIAPSGNFGIKHLQDSIYLNVAGSSQKILIDLTTKVISKVGWSEEESFVFITTDGGPSRDKSSTLYIFDIANTSITQKFNSDKTIYFYITKDLLIFDNTFAGQSTIEIFNYRKNANVNVLKLWGGCGLAYISDL
jgi:hypothetical protein